MTPALVAPRRPVEHPDDLGKIRGIGEIYKERLFAAGIYTWQQVVDSEPEVLRRITRAKPNADIGDWQSQAQALVKQFNRGGATYSGPAPEDLALIDGIGPAAMEALYQAGITTFARLAAATPVELAAILPAPTIGMEFHFSDWIAQAAQRAQRPAPQAG
jgi:predicted flap endonuclease-1-like 5' DNA nuclease